MQKGAGRQQLNSNIWRIVYWLYQKHMTTLGTNDPMVLDDMTYSYEPGTNTLKSVSESSQSGSTNPQQYDGLGDFRDVSGNTDYTYDANGNLASDANRGISEIKNRWFTVNKPLEVTLANGNTVTYVYDALGNLLRKKAGWQDLEGDVMINKQRVTDYVGELVFESPNGIGAKAVLIMHDEGRIRINQTNGVVSYHYDYYLRDHLDNIRAIVAESATQGMDAAFDPSAFDPAELANPNPPAFSVDPVGYIATSEVSNATWETQLFDRVSETRGTRPGGISTDPEEQFAADLNAASSAALGPGKLIKVMAGDRIQLGAEAFYYSNAQPETPPLPINLLVNQVISAISGAAAANGEIASSFAQASVDFNNSLMALTDIQSESPNDTTQPAAYLNYLVFDDGFNLRQEQSGMIQVGQADAWNGIDVPQFEIDKNGYIYVFTSNRSAMSVSTDNLYLYHWKGALLEEMHYYPYGLTFDVNRQMGLKASDVRYNSQSLEQNEFTSNAGTEKYGLEWYDFMARSYDVQLGRWMQPDPMMQHASPYLAMGDNPTLFTDPLGLEDSPIDIIGRDWLTGKEVKRVSAAGDHQYYWLQRTEDGDWESKGEAPAPYEGGSGGDFYAEPIANRKASFTGPISEAILAYNANLDAEDARRAAVQHDLKRNAAAPWMSIATGQLGQEEENPGHNSSIIGYHATTGGFKDDETPWCSSFVNWSLKGAGIKGTNSARALSWSGWGNSLKKPAYGSIAIINYGGGKGHVGFVAGMNRSGRVILLGGNQSDMVKYSAFSRSSIKEYVYPPGYVPYYNLPLLQIGGKSSYHSTR